MITKYPVGLELISQAALYRGHRVRKELEKEIKISGSNEKKVLQLSEVDNCPKLHNLK